MSSFLGNKDPSHWHEVAWKAAIALNCQPNESTGYTPFYLFYGRHPDILPGTDVVVSSEADQFWQTDLKIAKFNADHKRALQSSSYKYRKFLTGEKVLIRPDNSKNAKSMSAVVIEDSGGATMRVKLSERARPISVHKGMTFLEKYSNKMVII